MMPNRRKNEGKSIAARLPRFAAFDPLVLERFWVSITKFTNLPHLPNPRLRSAPIRGKILGFPIPWFRSTSSVLISGKVFGALLPQPHPRLA